MRRLFCLLSLALMASACSNEPSGDNNMIVPDVGDEPDISDGADLGGDMGQAADMFVPPEDCSATHESGLPAPTGRYCVGVTSAVLTDDAPDTILGTGMREVVVHAYYPTYIDTGDAFAPVPENIWQMLGLTGSADNFVSHAIVDAPIAQGDETFGTLFFMPGYTVNVGPFTSWIESLVSHGWVVIAIEHPGISTTVYPDGSVVDSLPRPVTLDETYAMLEEHFERVADDVLFVRESVANSEGIPFDASRLELDEVVYFGESYGGATAVAVCELDDSCVASLNVDGRFFFGTPTAVWDTASKPWGIILADGRFHEQDMPDDATLVQVWDTSTASKFYAEFAGSTHLGISDLLFYFEATGQTAPPAVGTIHRLDVYEGVTTILHTFVDAQLRGGTATIAEAVAGSAAISYGE